MLLVPKNIFIGGFCKCAEQSSVWNAAVSWLRSMISTACWVWQKNADPKTKNPCFGFVMRLRRITR